MHTDIQQKEKEREKELNMKKSDIILAGVGGQGILSIAAIIGEAALAENLYIKQAEVHGMSQRGGDVQSNLRLADHPISSDLISLGGADCILSLEPMEALRYLPYLNKEGWIITSSSPFVNIPNKMRKRHSPGRCSKGAGTGEICRSGKECTAHLLQQGGRYSEHEP